MTRVDSSYIRSINFDSGSHTMTVHFRDGSIVKYASVHPRTYQAVLNADSVGEKFTDLVRDKHKFTVVKRQHRFCSVQISSCFLVNLSFPGILDLFDQSRNQTKLNGAEHPANANLGNPHKCLR